MFKYLVILALIVWGVVLLQNQNGTQFGGGSGQTMVSGIGRYDDDAPGGSSFGGGGGGGGAGGGIQQTFNNWIQEAQDSFHEHAQSTADWIREHMHR